jgi:site-specific recombinase XerC
MDHKESFLQYLQIEKRYSPLTVRSYLNDLDQFDKYLIAQELPGSPEGITSLYPYIVRYPVSGCFTAIFERKDLQKLIPSKRLSFLK